MIRLQQITENNFQDCIELKVTVCHADYVDTVLYSFAEAWLDYDNYKLFAVTYNEQVIGFVSLYVGEQHYQIINFLIADAFQHKGYGQQAAKLCMDYLKTTFNANTISLPVHPNNDRALRFWEKLAFKPSNYVENGYIWLRFKQ